MLHSDYIYQDQLQSFRLVTRFLTRDDIEIWTDFFKDEEAMELTTWSDLNVYIYRIDKANWK